MEFQLDTDNKEFQDALQLITHTRQSVFLTGKAGTGKSTFLKYICTHTKKKYVVLAPTGIAAINAEGVTLHSFFKLPFRPMLPDDPDLSLKNGRIFEFFKYRKEHRKLISEVELIIIDEISMVRADIIDCVDRILRVFSGNMRLQAIAVCRRRLPIGAGGPCRPERNIKSLLCQSVFLFGPCLQRYKSGPDRIAESVSADRSCIYQYFGSYP